jgi:GTP-binding protein EngB required for normal cell division
MSGAIVSSALTADGAFRVLHEVATGLEQPSLAAAIERTASAVSARQLTVAVLGQFKRGKSTLLNALIGRAVLPSGLLPVTSVPVSIRAGPEEVRVVGQTGETRAVPLDRIPEFVTEERNPGNRLGVREVELRIPLPAWAQGVTFVDSPGIGSVVEENTRAARDLLPTVDAAIYVISPDPPLTDNDQRFLQDASVHATKFFFVLNKADLLAAPERTVLLEYSASVLRDRCGFASVRIFPLSAADALRANGASTEGSLERSGVAALVRALEAYLTVDRSAAVEQVWRRRAIQYTDRLREMLDLALRSSRLSERVFAEKSAALERGLAELERERRAANALLDDEVRVALEGVGDRLREFCQSEAAGLVTSLDAFVAAAPERSGAGLAQRFNARFAELVQPRVAALRAELSRGVSDALATAFRGYEERMGRSIAGFERVAAGLFDLELTPIGADVALSAASQYRPQTSSLFEGTMAGQTVLVLPAAVLRRGLRGRMRRLVDEELDAQCGRIRSDLVERSARSVAEFQQRTRGQVEVDVDSIRTALRQGSERHALQGPAAVAWNRVRAEWLVRLSDLRTRVDGTGA